MISSQLVLQIHQCQSNLTITQQVFDELGVPLAPNKLEGPTTVLTYLGIEIDSADQVIRLPNDKYSDLHSQLAPWIGKKKCTKRELLSLIGKLSFAAKVVWSGRLFLRRLIDLNNTAHKLQHHTTPNAEARKDIQWWLDFLPTWNGISIFPDDNWTPASQKLPHQKLVMEPTVRKTGSVVPGFPTCKVSPSNGKNCSQST